jgi:hypothetical protein
VCCAWCVVQVSSCLASIAQGMNAKSRAWVARSRNGQQQQQRMGQQGASAADAFAQSPFKGLSSAMGEGGAAADAAGSVMDGLLGLGKSAAGEHAPAIRRGSLC